MISKIEQTIDEMQEYIESCKTQPLSNGARIIVNREEIEELLNVLREALPKEIKNYQKMVSNQEAILANARAKAEEIVAAAEIQTSELVSEHEIMQQAYAHANEVVSIATNQAQEILDTATTEANEVRMSAITYTDDMLKSLQEIISNSIDTAKARTENLTSSLQGYLDIVTSNRAELAPPEPQQDMAAEAVPAQEPLTQPEQIK